MSVIQSRLIENARRLHEQILPCGGVTRLEDCFTVDGGRLLFWFNLSDGSTHILSVRLEEN